VQEATFSDADVAWNKLLRSMQLYSVGLLYGGGHYGKSFMVNMKDPSTEEQKIA